MSETKQWSSEAGPIQTKRVNDALRAIRSEGQSYTEKTGVIGVSEHEWHYQNIFGGMREDAAQVLAKLGEEFGWKVTRENYQTIINRCGEEMIALQSNRPVKDQRVTVEQEAEKQAQRDAAQAEREAQDAEKRRQVAARANELREQYPWARGVRNMKSESAGAAACLKYELNQKFPGVPFSVTSDYSSISVHWNMGPTTKEVSPISSKYQNASFDGQTDSTNYDHSVEGEAITQVLGRVRFVSIQREWPADCDYEKLGAMIRLTAGKEIENHGPTTDHAHVLYHKTAFQAGEKIIGVELCQWVDGVSDNDTWHWCKIVTQIPAAVPTATPTTSADGVAVRRNMQHNGIEVEFPSKPAQNTINLLKASGFRWSQRQGVWYKKFSPVTWETAHKIVGLEVPELPAEKVDMVDRFDQDVEDRMAEQCGLTGTHD